jgi:hypothetical protein
MSFVSQLRSIAQESYNKRNELSMLVTALVISALAGFVIHYQMFGYYENAKIGFFILVCCAMWMGLFDSILCICDKRDVLERDKFSGLNPLVYMAATILFQAFHALLQAAVMCVVTGLLVEWPSDTTALVGTVAFEYFTTIFLVTFASQMLGLAVSALMRTSEKALTFAPFLLIYELIMSETLFGLPSFLEPLRGHDHRALGPQLAGDRVQHRQAHLEGRGQDPGDHGVSGPAGRRLGLRPGAGP